MTEYQRGARYAEGVHALPEMPANVRANYDAYREGMGVLPDEVTEWLDSHGLYADEDTETDEFRDGFYTALWIAMERRFG